MERCCEEELWRSVVVRWCRDMMCGKCCERVLWRSVVRECCGEFVWPCFVGGDVTRIVLEGWLCCRSVWHEVFWRSVGKKSIGKNCWGRMVQRSVAEKCCRDVLERGIQRNIFL